MPSLLPPVMSVEGLRKTRTKIVSDLVKPLASKPIHVRQIGPGRTSYTLGALPKGQSPSLGINREDPLVAMKVQDFSFNYHETWHERADGDYELERAYLHIHRALSRDLPRVQVLSLHCDPCLSPGEVHYRYKRGPHLHVLGAKPDLERAHISLCLRDEELGGRDVASITRAMTDAITMIVKELVPCWERAARA